MKRVSVSDINETFKKKPIIGRVKLFFVILVSPLLFLARAWEEHGEDFLEEVGLALKVVFLPWEKENEQNS